MKHTTAKQDAAFVLHSYAEAIKPRQIGDRVLAKGGGETTIAAINGETAALANGEQWHVSKLRSAPEAAAKIKLSEVEICTRDYEFAHDHAPRGRGCWAFYFENDPRTAWWAPGSLLYSEACRHARAEAQRRGVTSVSVAT